MSRNSTLSWKEPSKPHEDDDIGGYSLVTLRHLAPDAFRIIDDADWQLADSFEQRFSVAHYGFLPPMDPGSPYTILSESFAPPSEPSPRELPSLDPSLRLASGSGADKRHKVVKWQCSFWFLGCGGTFDNLDVWDTHCQSHFRGKLPRTTSCPFDCSQTFRDTSGQNSWREQRAHIEHDHRFGGQMKTCVDKDLIGHLWRTKVISDAEEQELRRCGRLEGDSVYLDSACSSRDIPRRGL